MKVFLENANNRMRSNFCFEYITFSRNSPCLLENPILHSEQTVNESVQNISKKILEFTTKLHQMTLY